MNKGVGVEYGGNRLITDQWWEPLTNARETTISENGPKLPSTF